MLVGSATRLARFMVGLPKGYLGVLRLGVVTDSWDRTGTVEAESDAWRTIADETIVDVLQGLRGPQTQQPPPLSAKKLGGVPAHRRVRRGEHVRLPPNAVTVESVEIVERDGAFVTFRVWVSSGTYVRWLAHEVGRRLGCGAHLHALRREAVGAFRVEDAVVPDAIAPGRLLPSAAAVSHLPSVQASPRDVEDLRHGRAIERPAPADDGHVAVLDADRLVAVARCADGRLVPQVVLA